jgi:type I restriction enzyme S subunit
MIETKFKPTEIGLIPEDWNIQSIGDLFDFKNGLNKEKTAFGYGTPIINYMDVYKNYGLSKKDVKGLVSLSSDEIKRFDVQRGDVFFTRTSETPEEVGLSAVLLDDIDSCVFSGFVLRARPTTDKLSTLYCKYCFLTNEFRSKVISSCTYTTRALTNGSLLSKIIIGLPPVNEQQRIASALTSIDNLLSSLDKLIAKKRNIKQGAMQQLLTGKTRLKGFTEPWVEKKLGELLSLKNGYSFKSSTYNKNGLYKVITITNVQKGKLELTEVKTISSIPDDIQEHQKLKIGDILLSMTGNIGRVCMVDHGDCLLNQRVGLLQIKDDAQKHYIYTMLSDSNFESYLRDKGQGAAQANIGKSDVENYQLFMPTDILEQEEIAQILSSMDSEIAALEAKRKKYEALKQGMMQQLLTGKIRLL